MQIFTMRYILKFRKLTPYGLTRPQCIRKSKQISGKTILSSPQDLEFTARHASHFIDRCALDNLLKGRLKGLCNGSLVHFVQFCQLLAFNRYRT